MRIFNKKIPLWECNKNFENHSKSWLFIFRLCDPNEFYEIRASKKLVSWTAFFSKSISSLFHINWMEHKRIHTKQRLFCYSTAQKKSIATESKKGWKKRTITSIPMFFLRNYSFSLCLHWRALFKCIHICHPSS